jgi:hypothetical protein
MLIAQACLALLGWWGYKFVAFDLEQYNQLPTTNSQLPNHQLPTANIPTVTCPTTTCPTATCQQSHAQLSHAQLSSSQLPTTNCWFVTTNCCPNHPTPNNQLPQHLHKIFSQARGCHIRVWNIRLRGVGPWQGQKCHGGVTLNGECLCSASASALLSIGENDDSYSFCN